MLQSNSQDRSLNYLLLEEIKKIVLKAPIVHARITKNLPSQGIFPNELCFSKTSNDKEGCKTEEICLIKDLHFDNMGILIVLSKIQEKYNVEIPYFKTDLSLKDLHNYIVGQVG